MGGKEHNCEWSFCILAYVVILFCCFFPLQVVLPGGSETHLTGACDLNNIHKSMKSKTKFLNRQAEERELNSTFMQYVERRFKIFWPSQSAIRELRARGLAAQHLHYPDIMTRTCVNMSCMLLGRSLNMSIPQDWRVSLLRIKGFQNQSTEEQDRIVEAVSGPMLQSFLNGVPGNPKRPALLCTEALFDDPNFNIPTSA